MKPASSTGDRSLAAFGEPDQIDEPDRVAIREPVVEDGRSSGLFDRLSDVTSQDRVELFGESIEQTDGFVDLLSQTELSFAGLQMGRLDVGQEHRHDRFRRRGSWPSRRPA